MHRWGIEDRSVRLDVLPGKTHRLAAQQRPDDTQCLLQPRLSCCRRPPGQSQLRELGRDIPAPETKDRATAGETIDVGNRPGQDDWIPVGRTGYQGTESDRRGDRGQGREGRPGGVAHHHRMVGHPERIKIQRLDHLNMVAHCSPVGPWRTGNTEAHALGALGNPGMGGNGSGNHGR